MKHVPDVYQGPSEKALRAAGMDETLVELNREARVPVPAEPGRPARHDWEYRRCGTCNAFVATDPLADERVTRVSERPAKAGSAEFLAKIGARFADARGGWRPNPLEERRGLQLCSGSAIGAAVVCGQVDRSRAAEGAGCVPCRCGCG